MGVPVSSLVSRARSFANDRAADHFSSDEVSELADGARTIFGAFNQNLISTSSDPAAPVSPVARVNNVAVSASVDLATGIFTLAAAPAAGSIVTPAEVVPVVVGDGGSGGTATAPAVAGGDGGNGLVIIEW